MRFIEHSTQEEWLEQRKRGVTATNVAKLATGSVAAWEQVRLEKLGQSTFTGNAYTRWGHEREPLMIEYAQFIVPNVEPNDLLVEGDDPRWLATPDGVGEDVLVECKTTVHDWPLVEGKDLIDFKPEYYDQVQWQLFVTGFTECVFVWEPHENFVPTGMKHVFVQRDDDRIGELVKVAEEWLKWRDTAQEPGEFDDLLTEYAQAQAVADEAAKTLDDVKERIRVRAGDRDLAVKTPFGSISYQTPKPRSTFDSGRFRKEHADLAKEYMKISESKKTLRVTIK